MKEFLKIAGWIFTVFYLYEAALNLTEFFSPRSVMPCVTRILDSYILYFVFPLSIVMAGIVAADIAGLRSQHSHLLRWLTLARIASGGAAISATAVAVYRILRAGRC